MTRNDWQRSWGAPQNLIAGESEYQKAIRRLSSPRGGKTFRLVDVELRPEPDNLHDECAVAAYVGGEHIGYLRAAICKAMNRDFTSLTVAGVMRGGGSRDGRPLDIGVHIWPDRRLTEGPPIPVPHGETASVAWPPRDWEIEERLERGPRQAAAKPETAKRASKEPSADVGPAPEQPVSTAVAGWYGDPLSRHQHRYFDGAQWTAHVADQGVQGVDPLH
jgi:hypothetical protein